MIKPLTRHWCGLALAVALGLLLVPAEAPAASIEVTETPATEVACYRSTSVFHRAATKAECQARIREDAAARAPGTYSYGIQPGRDRVSVTVRAAPPPVVNANCVTERGSPPVDSPVTGSCVGGGMLVHRTWPLRVVTPATGTGSCPAILQESEQVTVACTSPPTGNLPIPAPRSTNVYTDMRIGTGGRVPQPGQGGSGEFRVVVEYSHMAFDDPIVFPGQPGASHLHTFFGNTCADAFSTTQSLGLCPATTSAGGIANRSSYWVPSIIDTTTNRALVPHFQNVYYKHGGYVPGSTVQVPPEGLRVVAGSATATTDAAAIGEFTCDSPFTQTRHIPSCNAGSTIIQSIQFPDCWNGQDLDSPDHKSHMAYSGLRGCPASHPVPIPSITINAWYTVPAGGTGSWRLSSDNYTGRAGYSMHGDIWLKWDAAILRRFVTNCINREVDCDNYLLGDGGTMF